MKKTNLSIPVLIAVLGLFSGFIFTALSQTSPTPSPTPYISLTPTPSISPTPMSSVTPSPTFTPTASPTPSDILMPHISITSPASGSLVSGTVPFNATASDDIGVNRVEFFVDGTLKSTDTASPYAYNWDTANAGAHPCIGPHTHTLVATVYDGAGNSVSESVVVNMNDPAYCSPSPSPTPSPTVTPTPAVTPTPSPAVTPTPSPTVTPTPVSTPVSLTRTEVCSGIADRLDAMYLVNGDICDVVVVRESPDIVGSDGRILNRFTLMNSVLEFELPDASLIGQTSSVSLPGGQVYVMGDFSLLETELNDVLGLVSDYNWTVTGVHNHMILENPKTTFVHWETTGNLETLITQIMNIMSETSIHDGTNPSPTPSVTPSITPSPTVTPSPTPSPTVTPTPSVTPSPSATPISGPNSPVTLAVVEHLCPASVGEDDLVDVDADTDEMMTMCPVILQEGDNPDGNSAGGGNYSFTHVLRIRDTGDINQIRNVVSKGNLVSDSHCTATQCHDMSYYTWTVPRTDVTVNETILPWNSRLGFAMVHPDDINSLISEGDGIVNLNTRNDSDGLITIHFFNFRT